ncbi:MAG: hypothetical protein QM731_12205 [Chitinophagaceae bacterium]
MSQYDKYEFIEASSDSTLFSFASTGPNGVVEKVVQFSKTTTHGVYNLAFGNIDESGDIDDKTTNNNKDRNKILATIAAIVYMFTEEYPDRYVFFTGSTKERTRLYRMAINLNFQELSLSFNIYGILESSETEPFKASQNYKGFLIHRK